ncbi:MAG: hypothetical protein VXZ72_00855, partial [Chlamydiota bacterium]|nr:hypothetical protein [Chlamydiota bacterium]
RLSGLGVHSLYGQALIQRAHSGFGASIQGGGTVSWEESTRTLTWSDYLYVDVPGMSVHSIEPGSHQFSTNDTYLYLVPNREATSTVSVLTSSLVEKRRGHYSNGTDRIDIAGHDGVDHILIGLRAPSGSSEYFVFANGRVVVNGAEIKLDHSSVETMSFTNAAGTTTDTKGNVELKVTGTDGLELTTVTPTEGAGEATISLSPLWHDRFLTSLMSSPAETVIPTRVIFDSSNAPNGEVYLYTSAGDGELSFRVPGYDSTTFTLKLDGDSSQPGLTLGDGELAWIVLPDRDTTESLIYYVVNPTPPTSTTLAIQTGAISDFPEDNPNAFIIAYSYRSADPPSTDVYHFLGVQGLRDGSQWPIFSGEVYRSILSNRNIKFSFSRDFILEFGYDGSAHYVRTLKSTGIAEDRQIRVHRPGWDYNTLINSGNDSTTLWATTETDAVHVYFTWDEVTLESGHNAITGLTSDFDHEFSLDDNQIYFGTFVYNGSDTESIFVLWDGTSLHLDGETTRRYYGTSSRLEPAVQDGLEAAMDGGSHEPSSTNKFVTLSEVTAGDDAISAAVDSLETALDARLDVIERDHAPLFERHEELKTAGDPDTIIAVLSGFDQVQGSPYTAGSKDSDDEPGSHYLFANGGMALQDDQVLVSPGSRVNCRAINSWLIKNVIEHLSGAVAPYHLLVGSGMPANYVSGGLSNGIFEKMWNITGLRIRAGSGTGYNNGGGAGGVAYPSDYYATMSWGLLVYGYNSYFSADDTDSSTFVGDPDSEEAKSHNYVLCNLDLEALTITYENGCMYVQTTRQWKPADYGGSSTSYTTTHYKWMVICAVPLKHELYNTLLGSTPATPMIVPAGSGTGEVIQSDIFRPFPLTFNQGTVSLAEGIPIHYRDGEAGMSTGAGNANGGTWLDGNDQETGSGAADCKYYLRFTADQSTAGTMGYTSGSSQYGQCIEFQELLPPIPIATVRIRMMFKADIDTAANCRIKMRPHEYGYSGYYNMMLPGLEVAFGVDTTGAGYHTAEFDLPIGAVSGTYSRWWFFIVNANQYNADSDFLGAWIIGWQESRWAVSPGTDPAPFNLKGSHVLNSGS